MTHLHYRVHLYSPSLPLKKYIESYTILQAGALIDLPMPWHIMPDSSAHLLFQVFKTNPLTPTPKTAFPPLRSRLLVVGPRSIYTDIDRRNRVLTLIATFRPGGAAAFLPFPLHELRDRSIELETLWKEDARFLLERLNYFANRSEIMNGLEAINQALLAHLPASDTINPVVAATLRSLEASKGISTVRSLADQVGFSERHLRKVITRDVGLSPKRLARVVRVTQTLRQIDTGWPYGWAQLATAAGYYDQAHMIEEFQALLGESPVPFVRRSNRECVLGCCSVFPNTV